MTRNRVRVRRADMGVSQRALAEAGGVSRQALFAIETGRADPSVSTAVSIARALETSVEALFDSDVARHRNPARANVIVMGCAAALGPLCDRLNAAHGDRRFVWLSRSSTNALRALGEARTHIAGMHLVGAHGSSNVADVRRVDPRALIVTLAHWEVGLVVAKGNPRRICRAMHVAGRGVRLVTRERGSGARRMLERALLRDGASQTLAASCVVASDHSEVAKCVAVGVADVGPASRDVAIARGLGFVPLGSERFDLAVPRRLIDDVGVRRFVDALTSMVTRRNLAALGYDTTHTGEVVS